MLHVHGYTCGCGRDEAEWVQVSVSHVSSRGRQMWPPWADGQGPPSVITITAGTWQQAPSAPTHKPCQVITDKGLLADYYGQLCLTI